MEVPPPNNELPPAAPLCPKGELPKADVEVPKGLGLVGWAAPNGLGWDPKGEVAAGVPKGDEVDAPKAGGGEGGGGGGGERA